MRDAECVVRLEQSPDATIGGVKVDGETKQLVKVEGEQAG